MTKAHAAFLSFLLLAVPPVRAQDKNLWEWMNVAPIVAVLQVQDPGGREAVAEVQRVLMGELADASIALDVRDANRRRAEGAAALDLRAGRVYLALLEPGGAKRRAAGAPPRYRLVRGVEGVRELPAEGAPAWVAAAERIVAIRALRQDGLVWEALGALLADENPILVRTALEAHVAFGRGDSALFPSILPLLAHPSPDIRADAADLARICIRREPASANQGEGREVVLRLIAAARRDSEPRVRAAATRSLAAVGDEASLRILREIADTDPEQAVRFEAERILYEFQTRGGPRRD